MRLWQGDNIGDRVQWQFCGPGAKPLPFPSQFYSSNWDDETIRRTVGERGGNHSWYSGLTPVPLPGDHVCGPETAWRSGGVRGVTPEIQADQWGLSLCCAPTERADGLSGGGAIRVSAVVHHTAVCPLSGGGLLSVSVQSSALAYVPLSGGGSIGLSLSAAYLVDCPLSGGGVLPVAGSTHVSTTVALSGGGATGLVGTTHVSETCPLSGGGVITMSAEYHYHWDVTCPLSGGGEMEGSVSGMSIIGEIKVLAYDDVPSGWLECDGSMLLQSDYPELYAAIGLLWDPIAPSGYFALPNLQRKSIIGDGGTRVAGPFTSIGDSGGQESVLLQHNECGVPAHNHAPLGGGSFVQYPNGTLLFLDAGGGNAKYSATTTADNATANAADAHLTYHPVAVMRCLIYAGR